MTKTQRILGLVYIDIATIAFIVGTRFKKQKGKNKMSTLDLVMPESSPEFAEIDAILLQ